MEQHSESLAQAPSAQPTPDATQDGNDETPPRYLRDEIHQHYNPNGYGDRSTLNDGAEKPGQLAYVILYFDANPRWGTDRIIFVKSNLSSLTAEVLPASNQAQDDDSEALLSGKVFEDVSTSDGKGVIAPATSSTDDKDVTNSIENEGSEPAANANAAEISLSGSTAEDSTLDIPANKPATTTLQIPIAIYRQLWRRMDRSIEFDGWYLIKRIQFLEPETPDLIRMLEQKWALTNKDGEVTHRERNPKSWEESLKSRWAVVQWEKCAVQTPEPGITIDLGNNGGERGGRGGARFRDYGGARGKGRGQWQRRGDWRRREENSGRNDGSGGQENNRSDARRGDDGNHEKQSAEVDVLTQKSEQADEAGGVRLESVDALRKLKLDD